MSKKPSSQPAKRTLSSESPLILSIVSAFLLGLEGDAKLWAWTVLALVIALGMYIARNVIEDRVGFVGIALAWVAVVPAAASLAFDTGKWTHYGLTALALAVAIYFVKRAVNVGRDDSK